MIKVSVISIAYNDLVGLKRTVDSVQRQSHADIEHIVVDGGSSDGTVEYLKTLSGVDWSSERDRGRYDAMNRGLARVSGDVVWFMHAGDVFAAENAIDVMLQRIGVVSMPAWGYGLARKVTADGRVVGMFGDLPFSRARYLAGGRPIPHQAAFFSRSIVDQVGGYDLEHGLGADQLFMIRCLAITDPVVVPDFLCDFDVTGAGSTRSVRAHFLEFDRARRNVGLRIAESHLRAAAYRVYARCRAYAGRFAGRVSG